MPLTLLIVAALVSVAGAEEPPIIVKAYPWAPFISPMGEPFRPPTTGESPISRWFSKADRDRDGLLTVDEMQADADRFFARLDGNRDGQVDPGELRTYEWEIAPEIQVNEKWRRPRGQAAIQVAADPERNTDLPRGDGLGKRAGDQHDGYRVDGLQGAARYGLLNIPQPVASTDADFNRLITLLEFRQAAAFRFKLLDRQAQGRITLADLEARLPVRPSGRSSRPDKDAVDTRIGLPVPEGK